MGDVNPYAPILVDLKEVVEETPTIKTFVMAPDPPIPFRAGQFVQVTVPGLGESPFTPSSSPARPERMEVTVIRTGKVTDVLHEQQAGARLGLRGPFGKGYPLEKTVGKDVLIVGGGCGLAPLRALIYALFERMDRGEDPPKSVFIKYGAREPAELLYRREFDGWAARNGVSFEATVDVGGDGWTGNVGVVTTILRKGEMDVANGIAFSCGPEIMLRFVTQQLLAIGYKPAQIYLSMNRRMSCGMGKCGRCNIGPYYLCKDGPDICYEKIQGYANVFG